MTIQDTPMVTRPYCPACEPTVDPCDMVESRYCSLHMPASSGRDDERANMESYPAGNSEAGGADNIAWCRLLHRREAARPRP